MPVQRRIQAVQERRIDAFCFLISDGTAGLSGHEVFPTREAARKAWPAYRRETWARTFRGRLPRSAETFDGLTLEGHHVVHTAWNWDSPFPLDEALAAIDRDRANVAEFRSRDPRGAREIRDYLVILGEYFDRAEQEARRLAAVPAGESRKYPDGLSSGRRYGDL